MTFYYTPYINLPLVSALANGVMVFYTWQRRSVPAAQWLFLVLVGFCGHSTCYVLKTAATGLALKIFFHYCIRLFITFYTVAAPLLVLAVLGYERHITRRNILLLSVVPVLTALFSWSTHWHGLVQYNFHLELREGVLLLNLSHGPWYTVNYIYTILVVLGAALGCFWHLFRGERARRSGILLTIVGILVPVIVDVCRISPVMGFQMSSSAFLISGFCYWRAVFLHHLLDLVPIARQTLFEEMIEPALVLTPQGRLDATNRVADILLGLPPVSLGRTVTELFPPDSPWSGLATDAHNTILHDSNSDTWWHLSRSELRRYDLLQGYLLVLRDITALKQVEAVFKEHGEYLAAALLEEKSTTEKQERFLDMVSHEYRTPLAIIQTNIDIVRLKEQRGEQGVAESLAKMEGAVQRLVDIFEATRRREGLGKGVHKSALHCPIELEPRALEALATAIKFWGNRFVYSTDLTAIVHLYGNISLLKTAFLNLLDNAVKYSPKDLSVSVWLGITGEHLTFSVSNTPTASLSDDPESLFRKYCRGSNSAGISGTGLGLYLARGIIEQHGGTLDLTQDGNGTVTANIRLPLHPIPVEFHGS